MAGQRICRVTPKQAVVIERRLLAGDKVKEVARDLMLGYKDVYNHRPKGWRGSNQQGTKPDLGGEKGTVLFYRCLTKIYLTVVA